jgi:hypothetical protein
VAVSDQSKTIRNAYCCPWFGSLCIYHIFGEPRCSFRGVWGREGEECRDEVCLSTIDFWGGGGKHARGDDGELEKFVLIVILVRDFQTSGLAIIVGCY